MNMMATTTASPSKVDADLQEAIRRAMSGVRDSEEMRQACERMDRMREEIRQREASSTSAFPPSGSFVENSLTHEVRDRFIGGSGFEV